jgi:N-acylneuraminate cytidylyltransferase
MSTVAIITARGGSKRIPRKNIRDFVGKPIISYPIRAALDSGLFERVIVSTDDAEIAAIARNHGAETPFMRPAELSDDHTATLPVVQHAIRWLQDNGQPVAHACCIYPTAPFLTPEVLREGLDALRTHGKDYAFSVARFGFPIQRALRCTPGQGVEPFHPQYMGCRSQDLEPAYHDAGQFYWGTSKAFLAARPVFSEASFPIVLPHHMVQDIDDEEDWIRAEFMYQAQKLAESQCR